MKQCPACKGEGGRSLIDSGHYEAEGGGWVEGTGQTSWLPCRNCDGSGQLPSGLRRGFLNPFRQYVDCPSCGKANLYISDGQFADTKNKYCTCGTYLWV